MAYEQFAYVYDDLMQDAPYEKWIELLQQHKKHTQQEMKTVLDLGCGTGALAIPLAKEGFRVIGVDFSTDMLAVAAEKSSKEGLQIQWLEQDMRELELLEQVDTVVCFCDSLNYIQTEQDVRMVFKQVYHALKQEGYFLFDVHSLFKLREVFGQHTFATNDEQISLIWQSYWSEEEFTVEHELTFFVQDAQGKYERFDEFHIQKAYEIQELCFWLEQTGFRVHSVTADFEQQSPVEQSERIFIVVQKVG